MRRAFASLLAFATLALAGTVTGTTSADTPTFTPAPPRGWGRPIVRPSPAVRFELVDDSGQPLPTFAGSDGRRFVLGSLGERYRIHVVNPTPSRVEAVLSVDGLDAIDGTPASLAKRGYVIPAFGDVVIDGWRTSLESVAAFRFSALRDAYAVRTGHERNVGVIGVALFRERPPPPRAWPLPSAAARSGAPARPSAAPAETRSADGGSGLGTQFGEAHESSVVQTAFVRAESVPGQVAEVRYDDREGLLARGIAVPPLPQGRWADVLRRDAAQPFAESGFAQPPL